MRRRADAAGLWRYALPRRARRLRRHQPRDGVDPRAPHAQGLGLHNDLQNEFSVVANMMPVELMHEFGTPAQQEEIVERLIVGELHASPSA